MTIREMFGMETGSLVAIGLALLLFGIGYNALVAWAERHGYTEGYMSLVVAAGVAVVLLAVAMVNWRSALITLIYFAAAGTPMIVGSIARHIRAREAAIRQMRDEASHD